MEFKTRILERPGKTREATKQEELEFVEKVKPLLEAACEAEELFDLDYLERYAEGKDW